MNNLVGFDFSISKPAAVVFENNNYHFYLWLKDIDEKYENLFKSCNVNVTKRQNIEIKDIVKYDITNANILSDLIINSLKSFLNKDIIIAFEGASYASHGNVTLSLTAWKYILIYKLSKIVSINNILSYSPISVKSIAGCAKRGMNKKDMIEAFKNENLDHPFCQTLRDNPENLKKKTNYIEGVDDLVDAYFTLKTLIIKEKLS